MEIFSARLANGDEQVFLDLHRSADGHFKVHLARQGNASRQDVHLPAAMLEGLLAAMHACEAAYRAASRREASSPPIQAPARVHQSLTDLRKQFPRAYEAWTREEEERARKLQKEGFTPADIARTLGRQPGAIRSRLNLERHES